MAATYPTTVPDLLTADLLSDYVAHGHKVTILEELQAMLETAGAMPQGIYASIAARFAALETQLQRLASRAADQLVIRSDPAAPTTRIVLTAAALGIEETFAQSVAVTIDSNVTGKNGMLHGSRQANTTYHIWVGRHETTGEVAGGLATTVDRALLDTSHSSLAGFTRWRRVGSARTTSANALVWFTQHAHWVSVQDRHHLYRNGSAPGGTGWNTLSLAGVAGTDLAAMPSTATWAHIACIYAGTPRVAERYVRLRPTGATGSGMIGIANHESTNGSVRAHVWIATSVTQQIDWRLTNADGSTGYNETGVHLALLGWRESL